MAKLVREEDTFTESSDAGVRTSTSESAILRNQSGLSSLSTTVTSLQAQLAAMLAPGLLTPFAGTTAPTGWLMCNGQSVSTTTYAALFAIIGTTYGGGGGSFNVPDLRGRVPTGLDNIGGAADSGRLDATIPNTLGGNGGVQTLILTTGQIPNHTHNINLNSGAVAGSNHNHSVGPAGMQYVGGGGNFNGNAGSDHTWSAGSGFITGLENQNHYHNVTGNSYGINEGSGTAHNNMQPYILLNYLIKT